MKHKIIIFVCLTLAIGALQAQNTVVEYWFDSGYASRTEIQVPLNELNLDIATTGLGEGLHTLYTRTGLSPGEKSNVLADYFVKVRPFATKTIDYWFNDNDAARQQATVPADGLLRIDISGAGLPYGIHRLFTQPTSAEGYKGAITVDYFLKTSAFVIEYWFDDAIGDIVRQDVRSDQLVRIDAPTTNLSDGIHRLFVRTGLADGEMGALSVSYFFKVNGITNSDARTLVYWFDNDYENRVTRALGDDNELLALDLNTDNMPNALSQGGHVLNVRVGYEGGVQSGISMDYFRKGDNPFLETQDDPLTITEYTYWFDNDYANANNVPFASPNALQNLYANLDASDLTQYETHILNIRFKRSDGIYSTTLKEPFNTSNALAIELPELSSTTLSASCYPNPFSETLNIRYSVPPGGNLTIDLYNSTGMLVKKWQLANQPGGEQTFTDNLSHLPNGLYILSIKSDTEQWKGKVIKR